MLERSIKGQNKFNQTLNTSLLDPNEENVSTRNQTAKFEGLSSFLEGEMESLSPIKQGQEFKF